MYMASNSNGDRGQHWEAQLRKGCLEMAILASLWKDRLYGLEILRSLSGSSQLEVAEGTLYPILSRVSCREPSYARRIWTKSVEDWFLSGSLIQTALPPVDLAT